MAPQEFKGSLSAEEAADAIAEGIRRGLPEATVDRLPLADGGPGFIDAMRRAVRADTVGQVVHDALGREVLARFLVLRGRREAVVEAAQANGLMHLAAGELDPLHADSFGVGELIAAALKEQPSQLVVGVGGSATTDGGAGMARGLGARFFDEAGRELRPGGAELARLARIEWAPPSGLTGVDVVVASDVVNPLVGPEGAAAVYAPQKGANPEQVALLEEALVRYAWVVRRALGVDVATLPGGGAAGGLAAGLVAFLGARIESGFDVVSEATGLEGRIAEADVVVTGEGSYDSQSLRGKTAGRVREMARALGKPCYVLAGLAEEASEGLVRTLSELEPDPAKSMREARVLLAVLAERWAASLPPDP